MGKNKNSNFFKSKYNAYSSIAIITSFITCFITFVLYFVDICSNNNILFAPFAPRASMLIVAFCFYCLLKTSADQLVISIWMILIPHLSFWVCFCCNASIPNRDYSGLVLFIIQFAFIGIGQAITFKESLISEGLFLGFSDIYLQLLEIPSANILMFFLFISGFIVIFLNYFCEKNFSIQYKAEEKLKELTVTDNLTGCYNRQKISDLVVRNTRMLKGRMPYTIAMLDIDHFKHINDTYGHDNGDKALLYVVQRIEQTIRNEDLLIRWGGEEFIIILFNTTIKDGKNIAERIRKAVAIGKPPIPKNITVSIGISNYTNDIDKSIKSADDALYQAKRTGRNKVCCSIISKKENLNNSAASLNVS